MGVGAAIGPAGKNGRIPRMTRKNEILSYQTYQGATLAMRRLLRRYPVHSDCRVEVVSSPHWLYPFRYLIMLTGRDNKSAYWSRH